MKFQNRIYGLTGTLLLLAGVWTTLSAQYMRDAYQDHRAEEIREQVQVFTDRSLFAVGEFVRFRADIRIRGLETGYPWSSMLYVELVDASGKVAAQGKFRISGLRAQGALQIPSSVLSGDYYLKVYTRWMRNRSPKHFSYTALRIINPFRREVLQLENGHESWSMPRVEIAEVGQNAFQHLSSYLKGEMINLRVTAGFPEGLDRVNACITVVPAGALDQQRLLYEDDPGKENREREDSFRVDYLPDLGRGMNISGTVIDGDGSGVPFARLHFSMLGSEPDFFARVCDAEGRFILPAASAQGTREFYVTPEVGDDQQLEVRIDQDFDGRALALPSRVFELDDPSRELAGKIALNMQLSQEYGEPVSEAGSGEKNQANGLPFYGTQVQQLRMDDYVRLPNLEEVFINLIPDVQFYKRKGRTRLRFVSPNPSIGIYEPLIMIDHISVFDVDALLSLSPEKIERIDLINEIYLKGGVAFGGILAIYSRKGDMAGIDLPPGSYFFDFQSVYPKKIWADRIPEADSRHPDTRNTIYWAPEVELVSGKDLELQFQAPSRSGAYEVWLRYLDPEGQVLVERSSFLVK